LKGVKVLNSFERVGHGKLANWKQLALAGVKCPTYTTSRAEAEEWKGRVVARQLDHGMGGAGIDVYESGALLAASPKRYKFFVKYLKKEREFRFHIFLGKCIFVQEKLKKKGVENADKYIRSHGRGWCFAFKHFNDKPVPDEGVGVATKAVAALGLDFGAVDMAWSDQSGFTVLEVNSAPGIENTSLKAYVESINALR
jgi:glutathione synthase/RimK-type ligase-like ATP-grasp enzyme